MNFCWFGLRVRQQLWCRAFRDTGERQRVGAEVERFLHCATETDSLIQSFGKLDGRFVADRSVHPDRKGNVLDYALSLGL